MIALILQVGIWLNTDGKVQHVNCPIIYEQEQRLPMGCTVLSQGILYSPSHYIEDKMKVAGDSVKINALQEQIALLQAELSKAQHDLTKCLIQPEASKTQPFIYGLLSGSIITGVLLWNK